MFTQKVCPQKKTNQKEAWNTLRGSTDVFHFLFFGAPDAKKLLNRLRIFQVHRYFRNLHIWESKNCVKRPKTSFHSVSQVFITSCKAGNQNFCVSGDLESSWLHFLHFFPRSSYFSIGDIYNLKKVWAAPANKKWVHHVLLLDNPPDIIFFIKFHVEDSPVYPTLLWRKLRCSIEECLENLHQHKKVWSVWYIDISKTHTAKKKQKGRFSPVVWGCFLVASRRPLDCLVERPRELSAFLQPSFLNGNMNRKNERKIVQMFEMMLK